MTADRDAMALRLFERWVSSGLPPGLGDAQTEHLLAELSKNAHAAAEAFYSNVKEETEVEAKFLPAMAGISPQPQCCGAPMKYDRDAVAPDEILLRCPGCNSRVRVRALALEDTRGE